MFDRLFRIARNAQKLSPNAAFVRIVGKKEVQEYILDLNRNQLLHGLDENGNLLPRYVDDPFFKTREAAERYADWKDRINPNNETPSGIMNFYINGHFHQSLYFEGHSIKTDSKIPDDAKERLRINIIGLTNESKNNLAQNIKPYLVEYAKRQLLG